MNFLPIKNSPLRSMNRLIYILQLLILPMSIPVIMPGCSSSQDTPAASDSGPLDVDHGSLDALKDSPSIITSACQGAFRIEDLEGNPATEPTYSKDEIFTQEKLQSFKIEISPEYWKWLNDNPLAEQYVPANVVFENRRYIGAAVRYKGDYTTLKTCFDDAGNPLCSKLSLKVKFNEAQSCGRFHG